VVARDEEARHVRHPSRIGRCAPGDDRHHGQPAHQGRKRGVRALDEASEAGIGDDR
jgi:hypothetical protein